MPKEGSTDINSGVTGHKLHPIGYIIASIAIGKIWPIDDLSMNKMCGFSSSQTVKVP